MMKVLVSLILMAGLLLAVQSVTFADEKKAEPKQMTGSNDEMIAKISQFRVEGEKKLVDNKFTRKEVPLTGANIKETIRQKWEKMDAYYEGDKLVRIQLYPHAAVSGRTEEFYLMDNKLVFAFIQDKGPKHEGKDMGEPGKELYFWNDKLLKYDDKSGEPEPNVEQEKKMYETRLPFEISELLMILNSKK